MRVDYELTKLSHSLQDAIRVLGGWAFENQAAMEAARKKYDARGDRMQAAE